jgi:hypothetical protein
MALARLYLHETAGQTSWLCPSPDLKLEAYNTHAAGSGLGATAPLLARASPEKGE